MLMSKIKVGKIRPVAWKIYVQGREEADYVRHILRNMRFETTTPEPEPGLTEPPLWVFEVTSGADTPLMAEELIAILHRDPQVELEFETV
jgi:hypothetical protein